MQQSDVRVIKVIGDWLVHIDPETNLPGKCVNHEEEKEWQIKKDPESGRTYYFEPMKDTDSVWEIPAELVPVLQVEPTLVAPEPQKNISGDIPASSAEDHSAFEEKEEQGSQQDAGIVEAEAHEVFKTRDQALSAAKKEALDKATEIARVCGVDIVRRRRSGEAMEILCFQRMLSRMLNRVRRMCERNECI